MDKEYRRRHYEENKADYFKKNALYKNIFSAIVTLLKMKPCVDCGGTFHPCAMDFDHVRGEKVVLLSHIARYSSAAALVSEIKKCDLVCSNCHRVRTAARGNWKPPMSLLEITEVLAKRKKWYDREAWIQVFDILGEPIPLPFIPNQSVRHVWSERWDSRVLLGVRRIRHSLLSIDLKRMRQDGTACKVNASIVGEKCHPEFLRSLNSGWLGEQNTLFRYRQIYPFSDSRRPLQTFLNESADLS